MTSPIGIIADTGAAEHLMKWDSEVDSIHKGPPTSFSTASGVTTSNYRSHLPLPAIGSLQMHLLPESPTVVSVGKLLQDQGIGFEWLSYDFPYLILPGNRKVLLKVSNGVPVFSEETLEQLRDIAYLPQDEIQPNASLPAISTEQADQPIAEPSQPTISGAIEAIDKAADPTDYQAPKTKSAPKDSEKRPLCEWFTRHSLTHMPSHPDCPICMQAKMKQHPAYSQSSQDRAESFGGRVHIDTIGGEGEIT